LIRHIDHPATSEQSESAIKPQRQNPFAEESGWEKERGPLAKPFAWKAARPLHSRSTFQPIEKTERKAHWLG
jgi:hypothetical protein